jgi:hypothetical protein
MQKVVTTNGKAVAVTTSHQDVQVRPCRLQARAEC